MTVKELKEELEFYDEGEDVVFEFCDDIEVDSWTEDRWDNREVHIDSKLEPTFICDLRGACNIQLGKKEEE